MICSCNFIYIFMCIHSRLNSDCYANPQLISNNLISFIISFAVYLKLYKSIQCIENYSPNSKCDRYTICRFTWICDFIKIQVSIILLWILFIFPLTFLFGSACAFFSLAPYSALYFFNFFFFFFFFYFESVSNASGPIIVCNPSRTTG